MLLNTISRYGDLKLGVWYETQPVRKQGVDHIAVAVCVGDPKGEYGKLDSSTFMDEPLARKWGDKHMAGVLELAELVFEEQQPVEVIL